MKKTFSVIALLLSLVTILSFSSVTAFADETSEVASIESSEASVESAESSEAASAESSEASKADDDSAESAEASADASKDASTDASTEASKEDSKADEHDHDHDHDHEEESGFPWALVIFLGLIVAFAVVCFICIKQNNKFGIWLKNFFKDYKSEIKKITWPSREITIKSTIVVLVCLLVCASVISLLDFGLGKLVGVILKWVG